MIPRKLLYGGDAAPADLPLSALTNFNPGNPIDALVGSAGFLVFDDKVPLAGILLKYYRTARQNSCGRCTPCRTGSILIELALEDTVNGRGDRVDWAHILDSAEQMYQTSLCGIGLTTPVAPYVLKPAPHTSTFRATSTMSVTATPTLQLASFCITIRL